MTIKLGGGGSPYPFPEMPTPVADGKVYSDGNIIPHGGTLVDNIQLNTAFGTSATGNISGRLGESVIWTVNATDINAACDGFICVNAFWYDSVNDRLYVFGLDTASTIVYTAYITLETGAVTNVGSAVFSAAPSGTTTSGNCAVHRAAVDSGNFTLYFRERTVVINESTGAEVSNVAGENTTGGTSAIGHYATSDASTFFFRFGGTSESVQITKNGNTVTIPLPLPFIVNSAANVLALPWGDQVKMFFNNTTGITAIRTFSRTEFDQFVSDLADFGGLA